MKQRQTRQRHGILIDIHQKPNDISRIEKEVELRQLHPNSEEALFICVARQSPLQRTVVVGAPPEPRRLRSRGKKKVHFEGEPTRPVPAQVQAEKDGSEEKRPV